MGNSIFSSSNTRNDCAQYTVAVEESKDNSRTPVYRAATHPSQLIANMVDGGIDNGYDIFQRGCRTSRAKPCFGKRKVVILNNQTKLGEYEWWTYGEIEAMSQMLGSGILYKNVAPVTEYPSSAYKPAQFLRVIGIISKNRLEWFVTEQAANAYNFTLVPLYDTLGEEAVLHMLELTAMRCVATSSEAAVSLLKTLSSQETRKDCVESLILFDHLPVETEAMAIRLGIATYNWMDLMNHAKDMGVKPLNLPSREHVSTICFTSGSTGVPKGAMITHGAMASCVCSSIRGPLTNKSLILSPDDLYVSYLPLAHVLERFMIILALAHVRLISDRASKFFQQGAKIAIYSGDPKLLLEDVRLAEPTIFTSVPRLFMRINDRINAGVQENSAVARYLFNVALETKLDNLRRKAEVTHRIWDKLVFNKIRGLMGSRLRFMLCGGAPLDVAIQERMAVLFCCPFLEGYGLTETMGATFVRRAEDLVYGHVGAPVPSIEFTIESVPEMGYNASDDPPSGQLLVRGPQVTAGYFMRRDADEESTTKDGWFLTGDIVVRLKEGGRIKIIDRKKNMFKLSQGEYVAAERLEGIYCQAPLVSQILVTGDSNQEFAVAVICLDEEELDRWVVKNSLKDLAPEKLKNHPALGQEIRQQMNEQAERHRVKGFEKVNKFIIEIQDPFTAENDLLTPTFKLKRHLIIKKYKADIALLYGNHE